MSKELIVQKTTKDIHGVFVVKTNDTQPAWKYRVARLQEQAMTGIGLTMGHGLYFQGRAQNANLLERAGFHYEGTARECERKGDGFISLRHYAILRSDLPTSL